ncbi:MAG: hypothetical protein C0625_09610 [Arcobacter sp.]|nr:MAG: hypothetical protein C0625_09610 [Arcobacter sp.]
MIEEFEELLKIDNCMEDFFKKYNGQKIILFGAGFSSINLIKKLSEQNIPISAICDNNEKKYGKYLNGVKIISLNKAKELYPNGIYIISSHNYFWEIHKNLLENIPKEQVCNIDFECAHYFYGYTFKKFFSDNIKKFEQVYNLFDDLYSKKLFLQVLKSHFSGERQEFDKSFTGKEDWYLFNTLLKPTKESTYIDCGAYDGDTILLFNKAAENGFNKIFALEPDPTIQENLIKTIHENSVQNVEVKKVGAYNKKDTVYFEQSGVYSNILENNPNSSKNNLIEIHVDAIDNIIENHKIDIIKMDIEGAEYFALKGSKNTIKKYSPKLAICLYHNYEDFLRIPLMIKELNKNYKFYLRHQSFGCTDTILFAIEDKKE